jgi:pseudaminic acid biosynthesis-associated methylase
LETKQTQFWKGSFGRRYSERSSFADVEDFNQRHEKRFGVTRDDLYSDWLGDFPRSMRILEVGCNLGFQIRSIGRAGFSNLFGIDVQEHCLQRTKELEPIVRMAGGSALQIPFADGSFDLVYSHHVLIHFARNDLPLVMDEMERVSKAYIMGIEYYAPEFTNVDYRGNTDFLWKADYSKMFLDRFPDLALQRMQQHKYRDGSGNIDIAYLMGKP